MDWARSDVLRGNHAGVAPPWAAANPTEAFARPIRIRDCRFLPRTMETVPDALEAILRLPLHVLNTRPWQTAVTALKFAGDARPNQQPELANMAAAEVRAALLARGWLG
jgi:hypothetical protein